RQQDRHRPVQEHRRERGVLLLASSCEAFGIEKAHGVVAGGGSGLAADSSVVAGSFASPWAFECRRGGDCCAKASSLVNAPKLRNRFAMKRTRKASAISIPASLVSPNMTKLSVWTNSMMPRPPGTKGASC